MCSCWRSLWYNHSATFTTCKLNRSGFILIYRLFSALKRVFSLENLRVFCIVCWKQASLSLIYLFIEPFCVLIKFKNWQHARPHTVYQWRTWWTEHLAVLRRRTGSPSPFFPSLSVYTKPARCDLRTYTQALWRGTPVVGRYSQLTDNVSPDCTTNHRTADVCWPHLSTGLCGFCNLTPLTPQRAS